MRGFYKFFSTLYAFSRNGSSTKSKGKLIGTLTGFARTNQGEKRRPDQGERRVATISSRPEARNSNNPLHSF